MFLSMRWTIGAFVSLVAVFSSVDRTFARAYENACGAGVNLADDAGVVRALDQVSADAPSETDKCVVDFMRAEHREALTVDKRFHPLPKKDDFAGWVRILYCKAISWSLEQAALDSKVKGGARPDYIRFSPDEVIARAERINPAKPTMRDVCFLAQQFAAADLLAPSKMTSKADEAWIDAAGKATRRPVAKVAEGVAAAKVWLLKRGGPKAAQRQATAHCPKLFLTINEEIQPLARGFIDDRDYMRAGVLSGIEAAGPLCFGERRFRDGGRDWVVQYVLSANRPKGPRFVVPHDNEQAALEAALYAISRYGGGYVAIEAAEKRSHKGQDANRAFGVTDADAKRCRQMDKPHPKLTAAVMDIFGGYGWSPAHWPIMALHTNADGWSGNGGSGTISILRTGSSIMRPFAGISPIGRLRDEDNVVLLADLGALEQAPQAAKRLELLRSWGVNVIYEAVTPANNDCSLSNYVLLNKRAQNGYVNIEAEDGDLAALKVMLDFAMEAVRRTRLVGKE